MDPGSHVEFQISTKNTNLVEDHPMNISGKFGLSKEYIQLKFRCDDTLGSSSLKFIFNDSFDIYCSIF
jgi:hypothetical protein